MRKARTFTLSDNTSSKLKRMYNQFGISQSRAIDRAVDEYYKRIKGRKF